MRWWVLRGYICGGVNLAGGDRRIRITHSWVQNCFYDYTGMHPLKRGLPLLQRPCASGYWFHVKQPGVDQVNHSFPRRPGMAEAALQRDVFLYKPVERKIKRLRTPTHFTNPASRAHDFQCSGERRGYAGCIHHAIDAQTVAVESPLFQIIN